MELGQQTQKILDELRSGRIRVLETVIEYVSKGNMERGKALQALKECLEQKLKPDYKKRLDEKLGKSDRAYYERKLSEVEDMLTAIEEGKPVKYGTFTI